jgi:hypothetical protein
MTLIINSNYELEKDLTDTSVHNIPVAVRLFHGLYAFTLDTHSAEKRINLFWNKNRSGDYVRKSIDEINANLYKAGPQVISFQEGIYTPSLGGYPTGFKEFKSIQLTDKDKAQLFAEDVHELAGLTVWGARVIVDPLHKKYAEYLII